MLNDLSMYLQKVKDLEAFQNPVILLVQLIYKLLELVGLLAVQKAVKN